MAEWKMLVTIVHEGEYIDTTGKSYGKQAFSAKDVQEIKDGFLLFEKNIRAPLDAMGVVDTVWKPVFDFLELKEVFTWKARAEKDDERMPKHEELVGQYRRWAEDAIVNGVPDAWKRFEKQIWADHLCFVFPRPSGVGFNIADAVWIGLDGKPIVATMSIPREPGNIRVKGLGDVIVHEWLHSVDAYLRAYFRRDEESVVNWQGYDKAKGTCSGTSAEIEMLRQIPDPKNPGATIDDIRPKSLCARGQTTQWDPHILDVYLHDTVLGGARSNVIPKITRSFAPPPGGGPKPPDKHYAGYDWGTEDKLLAVYQDQISRTKPAHWQNNLGQPADRQAVDGAVFGGDAKDWTEVEKVAVAALLAYLPFELLRVLGTEGSVQIVKGDRTNDAVRQSTFIDANTIFVDKANPPKTPLDLQKAVLFELARVYLRKRVGRAKVRDQVAKFPWTLFAGLPFWGRASDDFARDFAKLTPWKIHDRDCTPILTPIWLLFELIGWADADGFWGQIDFGAWVRLHPDDTSAFATEAVPRDVYDDFADAVVVYVFGEDAYTQDGYFKKKSKKLPTSKYDFIKTRVMSGREFKPKEVFTPVATSNAGGFTTTAAREPEKIDSGPLPPLDATAYEFFATPYRLRETGGLPTPPDPNMVRAFAHWNREREGSPLHTLEAVQSVLRAIPRTEKVGDAPSMSRLLEAHGGGLLGPSEIAGFERRDVLVLDDDRIAIVVAVGAGGAVEECVISDPSASVLLMTASSLDPRLVRFVWRPSSERRTWRAPEGAGAVDLTASMRYLIQSSFRAEADAKYGLDPKETASAALLMLRELLHPGEIALPRRDEADVHGALLAFFDAHGRGLRPIDDGARPGDIVWIEGGGAVGVVDRVGEDGAIRSVIAGGAQLPNGKKGLAPVKRVDPRTIRHVWRPTLEPRCWTVEGERPAPLFADVSAGLNRLFDAVGRREIRRAGKAVDAAESGPASMLALLVDGGGTEAARATFADMALQGTFDDFQRVVADKGLGMAPYVAGAEVPRGAFIAFHDARVRGEAPAVAVVADVQNGLPTKLVLRGDRVGRAAVLTVLEGPVSAADIRMMWVPTSAPRELVGPGADPFAPFYGGTDAALRRVLRYLGTPSVRDAGGTTRYFGNPVALVQLLARDAPEPLRRQLQGLGDDMSPSPARMRALLDLLDTWGEGLAAPSPATLAPGVVIFLRDQRGGVVLSVDAAAGTVEALVSGPVLARLMRLPIADVEHVFRPASTPRTWARPADVSAEYRDIDALLNQLRRYEGWSELDTQYINTPAGLVDSRLLLRSENVSAALRAASGGIQWTTSDFVDVRRFVEAHGQGLCPLGAAPVRVGDLLFREDALGVVMTLEEGRPARAMWTGRALQRGGVDAPRIRGFWSPSSAARVWERPGDPVSPEYVSVSRFLNALLGHLGRRELFGGYRLDSPSGFVVNAVIKTDALSPAVRQRLSTLSFGDPPAACWKCLGGLGEGLVAYTGQPLAPGDFIKTKAGSLAIVASTRDGGKPARAIHTQYGVTLADLAEADIESFWRPSALIRA